MACSSSMLLLTLNARKESVDFIGLIQNGKLIPIFFMALSSKGLIVSKRGVCAGITACCSQRLQYLWSHLSSLSSEGETRSCFSQRIGTSELTGKSQYPTIASALPLNSDSADSA